MIDSAAPISSTTATRALAGDAATTSSAGTYAQQSLGTIEWPQLCQYVAGFASTSLGQRELCDNLRPPETERGALAMIRQTRALQLMQEEYIAEIDFGGIQTVEAEQALKRVTRGGMLNGVELLAVASLIRGSHKVARKVRDCAAQAADEGYDAMVEGLRPISEVFASFEVPFGVAADIAAKLEESGAVKESASDDVRRAAGRVRTLENRVRGILKNWGEAIEEHGGRLCVVLGMGATPPKGSVTVGGKLGGAAVIEPPAAVNINNDLVQARSELKAAEDAVLWELTKAVERAENGKSAAGGDLSRCLSAIVWLDGVNAKYRFGNWMSGTLVTEFAQFQKTGRARGGSKKASREGDAAGGGEAWLLMIRKLRHPLLMARYLLAEGSSSGSRSVVSSSTTIPSPSSASRSKRLPGWRKDRPSDDDASSSDEDESLPPPVPIDILVEQGTKGVVITGPNTGGKTASLKALGLAVCMAKCGIPVPAEAPVKIPCFDAVYADIGDEQSLSASLSTFSGHLKRIEGLRQESTGKSLVLLDELGTGTDAIDGAALGIALMNTFARDGPGGSGLTLVSTHHSVLTSLKYENASGRDANNLFENASVEFDEVNLQPTYKLIWGVPGRSCALNIAERLNVDADIVQQARAFLGRDATDVDDQLVRLEALRKREEDILANIRKLERAQKRVEGSIASARYVPTF